MAKTTKFKLTLELEFDMPGDRTNITDIELIHAIARKQSYGFITQKFSKRNITMITSAPKIQHDIRFGNRLSKYSKKAGWIFRPDDTTKAYIRICGAYNFGLNKGELCKSFITYIAAHKIRGYTYNMQKKGERDIVSLVVNTDKTVTATLTTDGLTLLKKINRKAVFTKSVIMSVYDGKEFEKELEVLMNNLKTLFKAQ